MMLLAQLRDQVVANAIYDEGLEFLKAYGALCRLSLRLKRHEFLMKPKYHVTWCQVRFPYHADRSEFSNTELAPELGIF